jgi:cellulose 1,4-beta-cellobiosidase
MPHSNIDGVSGNHITSDFCYNQALVFDIRDRFHEVGGYKGLNKAMAMPWVLVMSIRDDVRFSTNRI